MSTLTCSVLMSVYNGQRYLGTAIDSILAQTFQEFEFIIVDDGSTDNTESLIRAYSDSRIRLISKPNTGLADSLNVGLEAAKGTWIARIDADDISEPQRLERQLQRFRTSPELVLLGSNCVIIDQHGSTMWHPEYPTDHMNLVKQWTRGGSAFPHASATFRRDYAVECGGYNPRYVTGQDLDLWLNLAQIGTVGSLAEPLMRLRKHDDNITSHTSIEDRMTLGLAAISCYTRRLNGLPDPSHGSDNEWHRFIEQVRDAILSSNLTKAMEARDTLRTRVVRNASGSRPQLWHLVTVIIRSPRLVMGALVPRILHRLIRNLASEQV